MDQSNTPDHSDAVKPAGPPPPADHGFAAPRDPRFGGPPAVTGAPIDAGRTPAPPLTPVRWLMCNGLYLFFMLLLGGVLYQQYHKYGLDGLVRTALVILGLNFVLFIHVLGHFLTAKWCNVHVKTFTLGFGPTLPGCSASLGETTYKLAMLPLGVYLNMVGEGPEADKHADCPRSIKNKTIGQRMLIISAGVIMNVLFGALCFIVVSRFHGVERPPAVVWSVESGSRAWEAGVRSGWKVVAIDDKKIGYFDEMKVKVALSAARPQAFEFEDRNGNVFKKDIEPRRDDNSMMPLIGVAPGYQLKLLPPEARRFRSQPVRYNSATASARVLDLGKGDVVVEATDPEKGKLAALPSGEQGWVELCKRLRNAGDKAMELKVRRAGKKAEETVSVPAVGFEFGDSIVGTTDPETPAEPFNVTPLPPDPSRDPPDGKTADPFAYRKRRALLAGKPMVVQVVRAAPPSAAGAGARSTVVNILVPPAYHVGLGMRMEMGNVAAVREDSPAANAGLVKDQVIQSVKLFYEKKPAGAIEAKDLDPVCLPYDLYKRIQLDPTRPDVKKWQVVMTVKGTRNHKADDVRDLKPMTWDDSWSLNGESAISPASPMSIPQLGVAYWVNSRIVKVQPGSPADKAGLKAQDEIRGLCLLEAGKTPDAVNWSLWAELYSHRGANIRVYDQWAYYFDAVQHSDFPIIAVKIARNNQDVSEIFGPIEGVPDPTWPMASRGLRLLPDLRMQKANSWGEAVVFGVERTTGFIKQVFQNLSRLLSGRISPRSQGGPVEVASQAYSFAGEDPFVFALFLGYISIYLAMLNFLPIPVLDGGRMVFLIYEKLRGRPPSKTVRAAATCVVLIPIVALMLFTFYLDLKRRQ